MRLWWISVVVRCTTIVSCWLALSASAIAQESASPTHKSRLIYFSSFPEIMQQEGSPGLANLAALVEAERAKNPNTLFIHGGASLGPSVFGAMDNGAHMIDLLNAVAPDVMAVGKREFSYGFDNFILNALSATFPLVTSNLVMADTQGPIDGTYRTFILETADLAIGVIAVTSSNAVTEYGAVQAEIVKTDFSIRDGVANLREEHVDAIILLADTDYDDLSQYRAEGLVDVIFYTHNFDNPQSLDAQGVIHKNGALDGVVLAVDIWRSKDPNSPGIKTSIDEISLADSPASPLVDPIVKTYQTRLEQILGRNISTVQTRFDTLRSNVRSKENGFANIVTDALRQHLGADAMMLNSGSIRGNHAYEKGYKINRGDIQRELPFGNRTAVLSLSGQAIQEALEHSVDCGLRFDGCFSHFSNIAMEYDSRRDKGDRIVSVKIDGEPLDPTKEYEVAVSDFMARGNDGFTMLSAARTLPREGTNQLIWNTVVRFVEKMPELAPRIEGRIVDIAAEKPVQP